MPRRGWRLSKATPSAQHPCDLPPLPGPPTRPSTSTLRANRRSFLAAFEAVVQRVLTSTVRAFEAEGDRPEAIGGAGRAFLEETARDPLGARLSLLELPTAGPAALDYTDAQIDSFTAFIRPPMLPSELGEPLPEVIMEAIGGGIVAAIQHEVAHGRLESLPELAPELTRITLAPFGAR